MRSFRTQPTLVAHDAKDAVGDAVTLDGVANAGLGVDGTVGRAQPTAAEGFARVFGRDGLVRLARRAAQVENELMRRRQSSLPVAWQARSLISDIPTKAPPIGFAHPFYPSLSVGLPLAVAVHQVLICTRK